MACLMWCIALIRKRHSCVLTPEFRRSVLSVPLPLPLVRRRGWAAVAGRGADDGDDADDAAVDTRVAEALAEHPPNGELLAGVALHLTEAHAHPHTHAALDHEHAHTHDDGHHLHIHDPMPAGPHSHRHHHEPMRHGHPHVPDTHHLHGHEG